MPSAAQHAHVRAGRQVRAVDIPERIGDLHPPAPSTIAACSGTTRPISAACAC
jgi:hypothetical protein